MMKLSDIDVFYTNDDDGIHLLCNVCSWETTIPGNEADLDTVLDTGRGDEHWRKHSENWTESEDEEQS